MQARSRMLHIDQVLTEIIMASLPVMRKISRLVILSVSQESHRLSNKRFLLSSIFHFHLISIIITSIQTILSFN